MYLKSGGRNWLENVLKAVFSERLKLLRGGDTQKFYIFISVFKSRKFIEENRNFIIAGRNTINFLITLSRGQDIDVLLRFSLKLTQKMCI